MNKSLAEQATQLATDELALRDLEERIKSGAKYENVFDDAMQGASTSAKEHAIATKGAAGSTDVFVEKQKQAQTELKDTTGATKGATVAMKGLAMAGNMLAGIAISAAISLIIKGIDELTHAEERAKERAEELLSTYNDAIDTANSHKQSIESVADRYEELSKGVNNLGENISLTKEEYQEYNSVVNDIAEMFPSMVKGYTDEGNAILKLKGNVEALRIAYEEEAKAAYNSLIATGQDADGNDILTNANNIINGSTLGSYNWGNAGKIDYLNKLMEATNSVEDMERLWNESQNSSYKDWFKEFSDVAGSDNIRKLTKEDLIQIRQNAKILKQQFQAEIESAVDNAETIANAYLMTNEDYDKLDEQSKNAASIMVNSLNENIVSGFGESKEEVGKYVDNIVQTILSNPEAKEAMLDLFTMDTSGMSVDQVQAEIEKNINIIADILKEDPIELKARLGFDGSDTEHLVNKVKGFLKDEFDNKVGELTLEELNIASNLEISDSTLLSWDGLIKKIKEVQDLSTDSSAYVSKISSTKEQIETLQKQRNKVFDELKELQKGGNVNLTLRPEIDTSELNDKRWDAGEGVATVFSSTYSNEAGDVAINFTPIIVDPETGEYKGVMSPEVLEEYAQQVISGVRKDDLNLQIGGRFEGKNAIKDATTAANRVHELHEEVSSIDDKTKELKVDISQLGSNISLEDISTQTSSLITAQETLNKALAEQNETGTISSETLAELKGHYEELDSVVEITTNGVILNTQKMSELTAQEKENIKTKLEAKEKDLIDKFNIASAELAGYKIELEESTDATDEQKAALERIIAEKENDINTTRSQIGELQSYELELENATSKHNNFVKALSSENADAGYNEITNGAKQVKELWDAGKVGADDVRNFVDYFSYQDMSTASIEEIKDAYQGAAQMAKKYFTESSEGGLNFLKLLEATEVESKKLATNNNGIWDINIEDIDKAAKELGVSTDFIQDSLNNLKVYGFDIKYTVNTDDLVDTVAIYDELNASIENVKQRISNGEKTPYLLGLLEELENKKINIETNVTGIKEASEAMKTILSYQEDINAGNLPQHVVTSLQAAQQQLAEKNGLDLDTVLGINTDDATEKVNLLKETVENMDVTTTVTIDADKSAFDNVIKQIENSNPSVEIDLKVKDNVVTATVSSILTAITKGVNKAKAGDTDVTPKWTGTAHVQGSAFAQGSWSVHGTGKSLVGELGMETLVRDGKYYTIGDNGAEFIDVKKDDIIFNHKQTENLFKYGRINSRGKALAGGSAYATGNAFVTTVEGNGDTDAMERGKKNSKNGKGSGNNKTTDEFKELFDWIEDRIERFQNSFDKWIKRAETAVTSNFVEKYYKKAITQSSNLMKTYDKAYERYIKEANKSSLDKKYKTLVQKGEIDIDTIKDEELAEKIKDYEQW